MNLILCITQLWFVQKENLIRSVVHIKAEIWCSLKSVWFWNWNNLPNCDFHIRNDRSGMFSSMRLLRNTHCFCFKIKWQVLQHTMK